MGKVAGEILTSTKSNVETGDSEEEAIRIYPWQRKDVVSKYIRVDGQSNVNISLGNAVRMGDLKTFTKIIYEINKENMNEHILKFSERELVGFILEISNLLDTAASSDRCGGIFKHMLKIRPVDDRQRENHYDFLCQLLDSHFNDVNFKKPYHRTAKLISEHMNELSENAGNILDLVDSFCKLDEVIGKEFFVMAFCLLGKNMSYVSIKPLEEFFDRHNASLEADVKHKLIMLLLDYNSFSGNFNSCIKYYYKAQDICDTGNRGLRALMRAASVSKIPKLAQKVGIFVRPKIHLFDANTSQIYMKMNLTIREYGVAIIHFHHIRNSMGIEPSPMMWSFLVEAYILSGAIDSAWNSFKQAVTTSKPHTAHAIPLASYYSKERKHEYLPIEETLRVLQIPPDSIPDISFCFLKALLSTYPVNYDYFGKIHDQVAPIIDKKLIGELANVYNYSEVPHQDDLFKKSFGSFAHSLRNKMKKM